MPGLPGSLRVRQQAVERVTDARRAQGLDQRVHEELAQADLRRQADLVDHHGQLARVVPVEVGGPQAHEVGERVAPQPVAGERVEHRREVAHGHRQDHEHRRQGHILEVGPVGDRGIGERGRRDVRQFAEAQRDGGRQDRVAEQAADHVGDDRPGAPAQVNASQPPDDVEAQRRNVGNG